MREPYVDETYYSDVFAGATVSPYDFACFANRASDVIDALTDYLIKRIGIDKLAEQSQELIKKATCAQIEYYQLEGFESDATGSSRSSGNASIGSFSYGSARTATDTNRQRNRVAPSCLMYLEGTGLLRKRGVRIGII